MLIKKVRNFLFGMEILFVSAIFLTFCFDEFFTMLKIFSSNVSRVKLTPKAISFKQNSIMYFWFFGKFLVKYEIAFFNRENNIEGHIATASIDAIDTSFLF